MSHEGKIRRGKQFLNFSDNPASIQADVEYYKASLRPVEVKEVKKEKKKDDN